MTANLTKQGVRNLDGPPKNQRARSQSVGCLHDWRHDPDCACNCSWMIFRDEVCGPCSERCRKCGVRR